VKISNIKYLISNTKLGIGYLVFVFILLGLIYTVTVPLFEAPDETWHFNYVRYVAQGHGLPSMLNNDSGAYQEVGQPPLYYLVAGLVTAPVPANDLSGLALHNPGFGYHAPGTVNDNKNLMAHTDREAFPWRGAALAIHLARLVSLAFGALTVLAAWALAREAFPDSDFVPMAAAAVVAFTPQFIFISSVTSNDSSAAALSTAALWAIARIWRRGVTLRRSAFTGLLVGLASLTKTSTILLGLFALAAVLFRPRTTDDRQRAAVSRPGSSVAALAVVALAVGGWWYAHNGLLYGDPLGLGVHLNTPWARPAQISIAKVLPSLPLAFRSFWGAFGWGNVEMSPWIYAAIGAALTVSLVGWMVAGLTSNFRRLTSDLCRPHSAILLMCALWCGAIFASFLRWNQQVEAPHGRLLFPLMGAFAVLLVAGLARLPWPRVMPGVVVAGFFVLSFAAPFAYILPAYAWPELLPLDKLAVLAPQVASRNLQYGDEARLIGFALDRSSVSPGEWLNVTLCWTATRPITRSLTVFVHLLGRENLVVGARNTWPGLGRFPTSLWPVGRAFCDTIPVFVEPTAPVPELYGIEAGLYDAKTDDRLEAADASGQPIVPPVVGRVRIAPVSPLRVSPQHTGQVDFGSVKLIGFDAPDQARRGELVPLQLYWRAVMTLPQDYTVFIHLLDATGQLAAQADAEPCGGAYPTSAWAAGEVIPDKHTLSLPANLAPGNYTIRMGLYLAPNGPRLPLKSSGDAFTLGVLQVR
jgi:4-amino-4-deoxy-L-arabinose transferase-like glycosyltransferase